MSEEKRECQFTTLEECRKLEVGSPLDLDMCKVCLLGRIEGHLYRISNTLSNRRSRKYKEKN